MLPKNNAGPDGERPRAALKAARERGVRLGNPKKRDIFGDVARERAHVQSAEVRRSKALARAIRKLRADGITSANGLVNALNRKSLRSLN